MHSLKPRLFPVSRPESPDNYANSVVHFLSLFYVFITITLLIRLLSQTLITPVEVQALKNPTVAAVATPTAAPTATPEETPVPTKEADPIAEREAIHQYIRVIFGPAASTAYAISLAEGKAPNRYNGEVVYNTKAIRKTASELSIGIFQINLKSEYAKVHFDRIPGTSLEEKIAWLQNPYNNTLFAYWVYATHANFEPWSVYTGGVYLAYLP